MSKLLSDEELRQKMQDIFNDCTSGWLITIKDFNGSERGLGDIESEIVGDILDLINTQKRLYAESVEVDVRLDEINRVVSRKYEYPSGRFIGMGKYYGRRTDELDAELRAEQRARIK